MSKSFVLVATSAVFAAGTVFGMWICRVNEKKKHQKHLIRPNIQNLSPYRCARDDYSEGILLDANENSYGPPLDDPTIVEQKLERYPCPYQRELKHLIGQFRDVAPDQIFLGVGSDEAIDLLIRICCAPEHDSILITPPTYGMYSVCAHVNHVAVLQVPLTSDFQLQTEEMLQKMRTSPNLKLIFLCNPGNPTATLLNPNDILRLLQSSFRGLIVVDEAYIDFSDQPSFCSWLHAHERLVVLQTLSKGFGLAGIRLGMAIANPWLIQIMNNVKAPYNINKLTQQIATKALTHLDRFIDNITRIKSETQRVIQLLRSLPFVKRVLPTDANFVVFEVPNAFQVYKNMARAGVVIRYRGNLIHMNDCLRATIGKPEENDQMVSLLRRFCAPGSSVSSNEAQLKPELS